MNARALAVPGVVALFALVLAWQLWLAPPEQMPQWLAAALHAGPLLPALILLLGRDRRAAFYGALAALILFSHGISELWSSPGVRPTDNTLELVLEAGLEYHCDFHDDEMPYPIWLGDKLLIEFPHQYTINDHRMQEEGTRHEFFEKFKDEFDYRYKIGPDNPTMMNVITHAYLSSRIPLIDTFEQIISYATSHKDVWLARRGDIAAWVRKQVSENK